MPRISIFIADDHAMVRMGLTALLESQEDFEVIGEAEDGEATVREVLKAKPDLVLMDLMMPKKDGVEATVEILKSSPRTKVVLLTSSSASEGIARALDAGAAGAILKSADFTQLATIIRRIAAGERVLSPEVEQLLDENPPTPRLTARQEEILDSVVRGLTNADIAHLFDIRESSVKGHITAICEKLGAANRTEAVSIALRRHLLKI